MPALALPAFWGAISATAAGTAGVVGAKISSGAASDAADKQTQAANHAADLQSKAAADALAFQKQQAAQDLANFNSTQKANYNQWLPKQQQLSSLGQLVGLAPRNIPAYEQTANVMGQPSGAAPTGGQPAAGGDQVTQAILDNYKALGVSPTGPGTGPTDVAYMVKQAKASLAAGERPLSYWLGPQGRIAQELSKAGGGAKAPTSQPSIGSYVTPTSATPPPAGTLSLPYVTYGQPAESGSLASLIGR